MDKLKNVVAAGAVFVVGFGAGKLTNAAPSALDIRVHALDLRPVLLPDGGQGVSRRAYGTLVRPDGGVRDINAAKSCVESPARQASLRAEMAAAAAECSWDVP